ncbi:MAG: hypothetical protein OXC05_15365 [Halieaceae bacterium]|nr:hypothetical protein [Halieaceae bacterium]
MYKFCVDQEGWKRRCNLPEREIFARMVAAGEAVGGSTGSDDVVHRPVTFPKVSARP